MMKFREFGDLEKINLEKVGRKKGPQTQKNKKKQKKSQSRGFRYLFCFFRCGAVRFILSRCMITGMMNE